MTQTLAKTPLHDWHVAHGGRMVDFAGWSMPVQYSSITAEHLATRQQATLFDVSHMGRFRFHGERTLECLDSLLTRRIIDQQVGQIRYSLMTNERGGCLDDVLVYRLQAANESPHYAMVVNASNREKLADWIDQHAVAFGVRRVDHTTTTAMIAVQGPLAVRLAESVLQDDSLSQLKYYRGKHVNWQGQELLVTRTGYTGEDGVELVVPAEVSEAIWTELLARGESDGVVAAGLGARDTLRLEAALPLYGHELDEEITPIQAGLGFAVQSQGRKFPGCEALTAATENVNLPRLIGLKLAGKRVPRQSYPVVDGDGQAVGEVTSGTFSPSFNCPLAMAYVQPDAVERPLAIDIRGHHEGATVVPLPFYRRT